MQSSSAPPESAGATPARLKRVLRLRDLIIYGVVIIQPIAPVPGFGVTQELSHGHAVTAILLAGAAMMLTAVSYGRMAALYPLAGSAYSYVGRGLNPHLGFLAGWAMALDYLILPTVAIIQAALAIAQLVPSIGYPVWVVAFVVLLTGINLLGLRSTAHANVVLLAVMSVVIGLFLVCAVEYLVRRNGFAGLLATQPFYDHTTFQWRAIGTATSFAALTYIGFDGVTTLAEDVENPRRNMSIAVVSVCAFTTVFSGLLIYLAQLTWPDYGSFHNMEMAFMDVTRRVGGVALFQAMGIVIMLGSLGAGLSGKLAAARLLFAMGRDGVLPTRAFGYLNPVRNTPTFNLLLIGALTLAGSLALDLERAGELLNFGAFLSFMGVNLAALRESLARARAHRGSNTLLGSNALPGVALPALGFLFCLVLWLSLPAAAKIVGGIWFAVGVGYDAWRTRGFRTEPAPIDFT